MIPHGAEVHLYGGLLRKPRRVSGQPSAKTKSCRLTARSLNHRAARRKGAGSGPPLLTCRPTDVLTGYFTNCSFSVEPGRP
ncbi:MAG TPA: hypothetical protein VKA51_08355, partial [Rubrobacteraceae bacterium]|nr:hypothetical protein [Rubrobacteraceae bacterium]